MILAGLLLVLCYAVVAVICLRARWDALRELGSETMLAMGFMIIGLLINEVTGLFIAIKHKLAIVYAFIGFFFAELVKAQAPPRAWSEFVEKQSTTRVPFEKKGERSDAHSSASLNSQWRRVAPENETGEGSSGAAENSAAACEAKAPSSFLPEAGTEGRPWMALSEKLAGSFDAMARRVKCSAVVMRKIVGRSAAGEREVAAPAREQQQLEARIVAVERGFADWKSQLQSRDETYDRLREIGRVCRELAEEQRRLSTELSLVQQRVAAAEENQRQVSSLWQQVQELKAQQLRLIGAKPSASDPSVDSHEPLASSPSHPNSGKVIQARAQANDLPLDRGKPSAANARQRRLSLRPMSVTQLRRAHQQNARGELVQLEFGDSERAAQRPARRSIKRQWRVGMLAAAVALVSGAAISGIFESRVSAPMKETAVAPAPSLPQARVAPVAAPPKTPEPRQRGTFQTVRPTQIYDGPSENAALIADIDAGIRLNVVDSLYGWLEVRSRHGRPPGFVRQEAAVRIAWN